MAYGRLAAIGKGTVTNGNTDNETVLQTVDNIVCFCGNIYNVTRNSGQNFFTLPSTIANPSERIYFPAIYIENSQYLIGVFYLSTNGNVGTRTTINNATVCLQGLAIHLNKIYYNNTIGNNDESLMTSPININ